MRYCRALWYISHISYIPALGLDASKGFTREFFILWKFPLAWRESQRFAILPHELPAIRTARYFLDGAEPPAAPPCAVRMV